MFGAACSPTAATTSARSSTSCAPTSSSRSTAPDLGPELAECLRELVHAAVASRETQRARVIPLAEAQAAILDAVARARAARGRPRATRAGSCSPSDVVAPEPVPPFANTAMDGYAVRAADTAGAADGSPVRLRVVGELPAGHAPDVASGPARRSAS